MYEDDKDCNDPPFDSAVTSEPMFCLFIHQDSNVDLIFFSTGTVIHPKRMDSSKEYDIAIIILEKKPPYTGEY